MSSRPKDLVDLALISLDAAGLLHDLQDVFGSRGTHDLPPNLPTPPADWRIPYRQLVIEVGLDADLNAGHMAVAVMLDSVSPGETAIVGVESAGAAMGCRSPRSV